MAYKLVHQETTPEWQTYEGEGEVGVAEFQGETTLAVLVAATKQEIAAQGGTLLSLRVWRDGNLWKTEAVVHASPFLWGVIIVAIALIALIAVIVWAARTVLTGVRDIVWGPPPIIGTDPETGEPIVIWEPEPIISPTVIKIAVGTLVIGVIGVGIYLLVPRLKGLRGKTA